MPAERPVLVAYGSKFGSTAEIAEAIGRALEGCSLSVEVRPAGSVKHVDGYSAVVLGSAVYMGRWRPGATRLLRRRRRELADQPVWLFSSGPVGEQDADPEKAERWLRPKSVERLREQIGAREHVVFGGCVSEDRGGFVRRKMAKDTAPDLRDRRDWDEIRAWGEQIAGSLRPAETERIGAAA
jgi:menaquinone-dependent protoporphyrinogen oxidase